MITEEWNSEAPPYIRGADLPGKFILDKIIVHWGEGLNEGSEHIVETTKYGGEVRLDHYDYHADTLLQIQFLHYSDKYQSFEEAVNYQVKTLIIFDLKYFNSFLQSLVSPTSQCSLSSLMTIMKTSPSDLSW